MEKTMNLRREILDLLKTDAGKRTAELYEKGLVTFGECLELLRKADTERILRNRQPIIETAIPTYTGGNIYLVYGSLSDGTYFIADDTFYDVRLLNENPTEFTENGDYIGDDVEWQEKHLVRDLEDKESMDFWKTLCAWILTNKPDGNYLLGDFETDLADITNR